jgi:hypothetical protein
MTDTIQFASADTGLNIRRDHFQDFRGQSAGHAHLGDLVSGFQGDSHGKFFRLSQGCLATN